MGDSLGPKIVGVFFFGLAAFVLAIASIFTTHLSNHAYEAFINAQYMEVLGSVALLTMIYIVLFAVVGLLLYLGVILVSFEEDEL